MRAISFNENTSSSVLEEIFNDFAKLLQENTCHRIFFQSKTCEFCECFWSSHSLEQLETDAFTALSPYFVMVFSLKVSPTLHFDNDVIYFSFHFNNLIKINCYLSHFKLHAISTDWMKNT